MEFESSLEQGMAYVGMTKAVRQTYFVFEGSGMFMIFSLSASKHNSGNFNLVSGKAVEYVHKKFVGHESVTSSDVHQQARRTKHVESPLAALNILYVLAAQGRAHVQGIGPHSRLFFVLPNPIDVAANRTSRNVKKKVLKKPTRKASQKKVVKEKPTRKVREKVAKKKVIKKVRKTVAKKKAARKVVKKAAKKKTRRRLSQVGLDRLIAKLKSESQTKTHFGVKYRPVVVETFVQDGESSTSGIRVRPVAGQQLDTSIRVRCAKAFRDQHPIGTRFKLWAKLTDRQGGTTFLHSPYVWEPEVLD